ncbi:hypothetical protein HU751_020845 [Pseudomonas sp. BW13M1]|uniref:Uncharacterized protein n=1 Tax=Pseudomonas peradeniyensis TaxID=2745488 RepID=A0A923G6U5_9PSED|nr:hypothetical protein [Pseudomonas peradeniyensis]MBV4507281.1 hypothetical protein [Pseudomonas peradeniyensis]
MHRLIQFINKISGTILFLFNFGASVILSIALTFFPPSSSGAPPEYLWNSYCLIIGVLIFIGLCLGESMIKSETFFSDFNRDFRNLKINGCEVEYMGRAGSLLDSHFFRLKKLCEQATTVKNTLIFYGRNNKGHEMAREFISRQPLEKRFLLIDTVINHGGQWHELYSDVGLLQEIEGQVTLRKSRTDSGNVDYDPRVMEAVYPVINFVIFSNDNTENSSANSGTEVWFGFGLFEGAIDTSVFRTKNRKLIAYFNQYWTALEADSKKWEGSTRSDTVGVWFNVSYDSNGIADCCVMIIQLIGRALFIKGQIFSRTDTDYAYSGKFESTSASFRCVSNGGGSKLDFTFSGSSNANAGINGAGFYEFKALDKFEFFTGLVFNERKNVKKIFGERLPRTIADQLTTVDDENLTHLKGGGFQKKFINEHIHTVKKTPPLDGDTPFIPKRR